MRSGRASGTQAAPHAERVGGATSQTGGDPFAAILYADARMGAVVRRARLIARTDAPVLISGESGTGKELVAAAIHGASARASKPMVSVNVAEGSGELLSSALFGHEKGGFTGAAERRVGLLEQAAGSTAFLDEFGEMRPDPQAMLLRAMGEGEFRRVGGNALIPLRARIIAGTNWTNVRAGGDFRDDLFYRFKFEIILPPLRERGDDIVLLAREFGHLNENEFSASAIDMLRAHPWPGNVRELRNTIDLAGLLAGRGNTIDPVHIELRHPPAAASRTGLIGPSARRRTRANRRAVRHHFDEEVVAARLHAGESVNVLAREIGCDRATVYRRVKPLR